MPFLSHKTYPENNASTSQEHKFNLKKFFDKPVMGWGVFHNRFNSVDRHFEVTMRGEWTDTGGILYEDFVWSDGKQEKREWAISFDKNDPNCFTAMAHDINDKAYARINDNVLRMRYNMNITRENGSNILLNIDDRLYQVRENVVMNKTIIKKFGLLIGDLTTTFVK